MQHAITRTYISLTTRTKLVAAVSLLAAAGLVVLAVVLGFFEPLEGRYRIFRG